jgi:glycosyltransferase involved in cell wall biosynthesis
MRIAMLAPIAHRIPPVGYGPWEQIAANLTKGLVAHGHEVTLFGPAGSETEADLVATVPHPLDEWPENEPSPDHRIMEEMHVARMAEHATKGDFDVAHSHLHVHALGYARLLPIPLVTTLHGAAWNQAIHPALAHYKDLPFVSISHSEREFFPAIRYVATVYNGIDCKRFSLGKGAGGYLLFAGRLAPEKAPHMAIDVAQMAGLPLKLAGMVEDQHRDYFDTFVRPRLNGATVEYLGPINRSDLGSLYRGAVALVMPLCWEEPFGLVVAEALASGTPVIGWRRGALPELIRDGITGELVDDVRGAVDAVSRVVVFDRGECRRDAMARFSIEAMTRGYLAVYRRVLAA